MIVALLCSVTAWGDNVVVEIAVTGSGSVTYSLNGQECTLTVKPHAGYSISKDDVTVQATVKPEVSTARAATPISVGYPLELSGSDPADLSDERQYTFNIPDGYGAYVTATFTAIPQPTAVTITMGEYELRTYSADVDLDFADVAGLTAYVCNAYDREQERMVMLKVTSVPAGTGVMLRGTAGVSYDVPIATSGTFLVNLLVPAVSEMTLDKTDGDKTNFVLSKPEGKDLAFYRVSESGQFGPNKAYLQLPTSAVGGSSRLGVSFEDVTGITDPTPGPIPADAPTRSLSPTWEGSKCAWYDLLGRRLIGQPMRHGIYLYNGKKVIW